MTNKPTDRSKAVLVPISRRQWRGLKFEARMMNEVFGMKVTPAGLVRLAIDRRLGAR